MAWFLLPLEENTFNDIVHFGPVAPRRYLFGTSQRVNSSVSSPLRLPRSYVDILAHSRAKALALCLMEVVASLSLGGLGGYENLAVHAFSAAIAVIKPSVSH